MLEKLFGNVVIEKILFFLLRNEKAYPTLLSNVLNVPLFSVQKAVARLEDGGIVVAQLQGKTRVYEFNPRFPMLKELKMFLEKAYSFLPQELKDKYYEVPVRKRPRRKGKSLKMIGND